MSGLVADFEGLVSSHDFSETIPESYGNLTWGGFGVLGKGYVNGFANANGYENVIKGKGVGFMQVNDADQVDSFIAPSFGKGQHFTLKSGDFAAAWNTDETVTFHAMNGATEVGTKTVVMDETLQHIKFGAHFKHITAVDITSEGGIDADGQKLGSGAFIALDNLKYAFDNPPPAPHEAATALTDHLDSIVHIAPHLGDCIL